MKSSIKCIAVILTMLAACIHANAASPEYDFEVNGIRYDIISVKDVTCRLVSLGENNDANLVIPSEVEYNNRKFAVIAIRGEAFKDCTHLISVEIPNSVKRIGVEAFRDCTSLTSVVMSNSITEILEGTFYECTSLASMEIPNSVIKIGYRAFYKCTSLVSVTLPNSIREIGTNSFTDCTSLVSIEIPNSVTKIGSCSFSDCTSLVSVDMPNSVTEIGEQSFKGCTSLVSIEIPNSLTEIGESLFEGCASLTSMAIPNSVNKICIYAFKDCFALQNLTLGEVKRICFGAFQNCKSLESLTIPGSVNMIEQYAVYEDPNNDPKVTIYGRTFGGCESLKEVNFPYGPYRLDICFYLQYSGNTDSYFRPCGFGLSLEKIFVDRKISLTGSIKEITVGEHIDEFPSESESIERITSYALVPPSTMPFSNNQYMNTIVRVPYEALDAYRSHPVWGIFWNLQGFDASGVDDFESDDSLKTVVDRYDLNGKHINEDYKGIAIIRFSDGSTKKVVL